MEVKRFDDFKGLALEEYNKSSTGTEESAMLHAVRALVLAVLDIADTIVYKD